MRTQTGVRFAYSLYSRLLLNFLPLALLPLLAVGMLAYTQARHALEQAAADKLMAVGATKKRQIEAYLAERESTAHTAADLLSVLSHQAFSKLQALRDARRDALRNLIDRWRSDIAELAGEGEVVAGAAALAEGQLAVSRDLESFFSRYCSQHGYRDLILLDSSGKMLYRFGGGSPADAGAEASVLEAVHSLRDRLLSAPVGRPAFAEAKGPAGAVWTYVGAAVYRGAKPLGILALQLPAERLQAGLRDEEAWEKGQICYVVGADLRLRALAEGRADQQQRGSSAGLLVDTRASRAAVRGQSGVDLLPSRFGGRKVCAFGPLGVEGLSWGIVAEKDAVEAILPQEAGTGLYALTQYSQRHGCSDILLVLADGYVLHTVMRGPDFQSNLLSGPYDDSSLSLLFRKALASGEGGIADFSPYPPAGNKPVAFIAAPLVYANKLLMVVVLQLPPAWIDSVMQERTGMGRTGETLLVGSDFRMRSNSSLDPEGHSVEASFVGTVANNGVDSPGVRAALRGETTEKVAFGTDYLGREVITAYAPVRFDDLAWALIAKQDVSEAFARINRLTLMLALLFSAATPVVALATLWNARRLARPVLRLADAARRIAAGELNADPLLPTGRKDELGILAASFSTMTAQIRELVSGLEQRVEQRTAELQAVNRRLESFSYSISHDLRTPLRAINGYSKLLEEEYASSLDAEGLRLLDVVRAETKRMGELIDSLLRYSRLGWESLQSSPIDMHRLAQEVFDTARASLPGRKIEFRLSPLPSIEGDPALLRHVWVNLIDNALKFSQKREPAIIEVGATVNGDECVYSVGDNGAGFAAEQADKLFGVFNRLHRQDEYEGLGVGLALAHRIIELHGGRIWAEGEVDRGACFHFALPLKSSHEGV